MYIPMEVNQKLTSIEYDKFMNNGTESNNKKPED